MSNKKKIYIIDFEDSFTFNIAAELYHSEKEIEVISHQEFFLDTQFNHFIQAVSGPIAVILGPGPGSPEGYNNYFEKMRQLQNHLQIYLMGICLGHQLLALIDGLSVRPSSHPNHGGQIKINFENKDLLVQRYNSLAVFDSLKSCEEIQVRKWPRGISYQFHPESIGTQNRPLFFRDLLDFIR